MNLQFIKYNKDNYHLYKGKNLLELFINKYKDDNMINNGNINLNFLYDILFIIQLFGNDLIPDSYEISVEIDLTLYNKIHYELYKDNNFIIEINNKNTINFKNFLIFLEKINNYNLFTTNILLKNFKIPNKLVNIITNNLKYNIEDFITKLVIPYLKYEGFKLKKILDSEDIRIKLQDKNIVKKNPIDELNITEKLKSTIQNYFLNIFDYLNLSEYGLSKLINTYDIDKNSYQTLYNYLSSESVNHITESLNNTFKYKNLINSYNEYLIYTNNINVRKYIDIIFNQTSILFYNFNKYNPNSKIYSPDIIAPSLKNIIDYLKNTNYYSESIIKYNKIYFNKYTHHLFITPYILDDLKFFVNYNKFTPNIINIMNSYITNLFKTDNINFRNINPDEYLFNINYLFILFDNDYIKNIYKKPYLLSNIK